LEQIGKRQLGQQPFMNAISRTVHAYFDVHYGKNVRSFVEFQKRFELLSHRWSEAIDEKKLELFKQHFSKSEQGMNASGSKSEPET